MSLKENGVLYIVPTPIGNLGDISNRVLEILTSVDVIFCEDTRRTLKLLSNFNIKNTLVSYYKDIEEKESERAIKFLIEGKNIALVSDSGTPLISDPGNLVVKKSIENNIQIVSVPGPSALTSALVASGFDLSRFNFYGFSKNIRNDLEIIKTSNVVSILYESPHRIIKTLELINNIMPDRSLCIAKEISKINESYYRGTAFQILQSDILPKGEFVLIIDKSTQPFNIKDFDISLTQHLEYYVNQGLNKKEAIKKIAKDLELKKDDVYKNFIED